MTNSYFDFLWNLVGRKKEYGRLLLYLHETEFYSLVPNDDNRGVDGEQLRNHYFDEVGPTRPPSLPNDIPDGPCTVLEMIIGVAFRLEFELLGGQYERPAADWFWVLIDNLGLTGYTDQKMGYGIYILEVKAAVECLLERRYLEDGDGGLFPLKRPIKDQRRVEIWYQMSAWVIENYPI